MGQPHKCEKCGASDTLDNEWVIDRDDPHGTQCSTGDRSHYSRCRKCKNTQEWQWRDEDKFVSDVREPPDPQGMEDVMDHSVPRKHVNAMRAQIQNSLFRAINGGLEHTMYYLPGDDRIYTIETHMWRTLKENIPDAVLLVSISRHEDIDSMGEYMARVNAIMGDAIIAMEAA